MGVTKKNSAKQPRRSQEGRSAEMQARLLQACIESLYSSGYAATTTTVVCEKAQVSRGAMLHHFPTRIDLMLFVVKAVYEEEVVLYSQALNMVADPQERSLMFPELLWQVLGRPAGVAVLEILQGARSDSELSVRLKPLQAEIERDSFIAAGKLLGKSGVHPGAARLMVWAIRGLSIAKLLAAREDDVHESVELLGEMYGHWRNAVMIPKSPARKQGAAKASSGE